MITMITMTSASCHFLYYCITDSSTSHISHMIVLGDGGDIRIISYLRQKRRKIRGALNVANTLHSRTQ